MYVAGSPPRMRGKFLRQNGPSRTIRLTPAHAGKIRWGSLPYRSSRAHPVHTGKMRNRHDRSGCQQAHPRACGEDRCHDKSVDDESAVLCFAKSQSVSVFSSMATLFFSHSYQLSHFPSSCSLDASSIRSITACLLTGSCSFIYRLFFA